MMSFVHGNSTKPVAYLMFHMCNSIEFLNHEISFFTYSAEMDAALMKFVNILGTLIMVSIVAFTFVVAKPEDAEEQ